MKVLHLPGSFFPDYTGGKEVFVYQLIKNTPQVNHIVAYHKGNSLTRTNYDGIEVFELPMPHSKDHRRSYFSNVFDKLPDFDELLSTLQPDIVHFHDFCAGASLSHLRICRAKGLKSIVTYHSPGSSCMQRGLIRADREICDGKVSLARCTQCRYESKGVAKILGFAASQFNLPVDPTGRWVLRNSTKLYFDSFREFYQSIDCVQTHATWVGKLLTDNDVHIDKLRYVEMGGYPGIMHEHRRISDQTGPLKLVFIGRCVSIKGAHLLIDAVKQLPADAPIDIHFFGPYWHDTYGSMQQRKIAGDKRFRTPRFVKPQDMLTELRGMDLCVIPSLWPETGPFSVFDAFAAGLPVIGTNHAGIAERISHGENGLLFNWGSSEDLARKLEMVLEDASLLPRLQRGVPRKRTFSDMARDIACLYSDMLVETKGSLR